MKPIHDLGKVFVKSEKNFNQTVMSLYNFWTNDNKKSP